MPLVKIGPKHQITIPTELFKALQLNVGDRVEIQLKDGVMYLIPQKVIPSNQAWFWTEEWQQKETEADEAIAQGKLSRPFETAEELIKYLHGQK